MNPRRIFCFRRIHTPNSDWLGIVPILLFCLVFEIFTVILFGRGSFSNKMGEFTLMNYLAIGSPLYLRSFLNSIRLSAITAFFSSVLGMLIGYVILRLPSKRVRESLITCRMKQPNSN